MFDFFEKLAVAAVVGILQKAIKNPASVAKESTIIRDIAVAATDADNAVNNTGWIFTPAPITQAATK